MTGAIASLITGLVAAFASAGVGIAGLVHEKNQADKNQELQEETNSKNEALMRESWQRDDTAIQRSLADAKAAGLSPLAGLGGAANSGPITLSAPQNNMDISASMNQFGRSIDSIRNLPAMQLAATQQEKQIEQLDLANEAQRDANIFNKFKMLKEFDNLDLQNSKLRREIEDYIGDMLARGVLSLDDTKGTRWAHVKPSNRYDKEDTIRNESNKNTARSNEISAWKESNRHEEWQSEFNSTTETREQEQEIKFSYLGQEVKLRYKESSTGQYIPLSAGIPSNEDPYRSISYAQPSAVISELGKDYAFYGWTSDGLPVLSHDIPTIGKPQYLAIVPKGKGSQLYKVDSKYVTKGVYSSWQSRYGEDYGKLLYNLQNAKSF